MSARKAAVVANKYQDALDMLTGGGQIEYDDRVDDDVFGGVLSMLICLSVECPHCGEIFTIEHDPAEGSDMESDDEL